ncbi:alpha/beta-hydrolase [Xylariaceae sp. FL1651]|nr:alpha/beta-hydrolase [Xylariaceae sp. FL1651]
MLSLILSVLYSGFTLSGFVAEAIPTRRFQVESFKIQLSDRVPHMLDLIQRTQLPASEVPAAHDNLNISLSTGLSLQTLEDLKEEWVAGFDWDKEQVSLNQLNHFIVNIEGLDIHFVHVVSGNPNAIPIILLHGWPGSFLEMLPLVDLLAPTNQSSLKSQDTVFDVVIPSLPGYGFSTPPAAVWDISDTARVFNTLMTQVLGYKRYAVHGTDWGSGVGYSMYDQFNSTVRATHLNFLPFIPDPGQIAALNISLSPGELFAQKRSSDWTAAGMGYFAEQATKPNTIGLSLYDSPIGQLSWIAEKFIAWSDPRQGTGPSVLTHHEILRHVSFYYLTRSFVSSVYTYAQNPNAFKPTANKARTDAPLLFTNFQYNVGFWPKEFVEEVGNLVSYKFRDFGGHFAGLDNPPALADDLRDIGKYWER